MRQPLKICRLPFGTGTAAHSLTAAYSVKKPSRPRPYVSAAMHILCSPRVHSGQSEAWQPGQHINVTTSPCTCQPLSSTPVHSMRGHTQFGVWTPQSQAVPLRRLLRDPTLVQLGYQWDLSTSVLTMMKFRFHEGIGRSGRLRMEQSLWHTEIHL